ncbi:hypothetical protein GCM10022226_61600 [Sphaerisporangium flaviroseum]|uniref:DUF2470 domain-containing protein n=1 Tax=Sphaerisporangium flaviroseum TaxID=509199 RepID=A0ABP7J188_9ACTN
MRQHGDLRHLLVQVEDQHHRSVGWGCDTSRLFMIIHSSERHETTLPCRLVQHLGPWEWTVWVAGVAQAPGATGDLDHDLDLLADHSETIAHHLTESELVAVGLMREWAEVHDASDPHDTGEVHQRVLTAVSVDGTIYSLRRERSGKEVRAETIAADECPFAPALARVAERLRAHELHRP